MRKTVVVCETQPVTAEGLRAVLNATPDYLCGSAVASLDACVDAARLSPPDVVLLDKAFGLLATVTAVEQLRSDVPSAGVVVWGISVTEPEAMACVQAGARGFLRKSATVEMLLDCIRTVASGGAWMDPQLLTLRRRPADPTRTALTPRERQVLELVGEGLKNREIAARLGIGQGTVKIHLKHIFEKTGARGRYNLALTEAVA